MSNTTANTDAGTKSPTRKATSWFPFKVAYLLAMVACLIRWRSRSPWIKIDIFSGTYLLMRAIPAVRTIFKRVRKPVSVEFRRERWGCAAAPGWTNWALLLMLADLAVFLDYGHWRIIPGLLRSGAQAGGLVLHVTAWLWKRWTDRCLGAAFANTTAQPSLAQPSLVQSGPFRHIRHPYYAAALLDKVAVALIFGSAAGWMLVVPWCILLVRQVRLEELHLRGLFGAEYESYAQHTARFVPGLF